jgi:hypothetical protein
MKKLFLIGALISALVSTAIVFAAEENYSDLNKSGTTEIYYGIEEGYYLTIPADLRLSTTADEQQLAVTEVRLASGKILKVNMTSDNYGEIKADKYQVIYDDSCITYTVRKGAKGAVNTEVTENNHELININAGDTSAEVYLTFTTTDDEIEEATKAGRHEDTLTFTVTVE